MGVRKQFVNAKYDRFSKSISGPDSKPYYQIINSDASGISGVAREFIGLNPGHKYKILIRVNTLESNQENGDWKYSVHATPTTFDAPLNYHQLSGLEALPDGQEGPSAAMLGCIYSTNDNRW